MCRPAPRAASARDVGAVCYRPPRRWRVRREVVAAREAAREIRDMNKVVCGRLVGFVLGISALVGCARVTVRPASKDSNERAGIPFYMQRPYVAIKQEIPAEGEEGYLVATLKGDKLKFKSIPFCVQSCLKQMG